MLPALPAEASLVQFPSNYLKNRYLLVRAGESYTEAANETVTNPVWKTSQRCGLSALGRQQVC